MQRSRANTSSAAPVREPAPARLTRARRTSMLKAIADPKRFELLERVAQSACAVGCSDLRAALRVAPATLSHHIKELEAAALIHVRREGKFAYLSPRPGTMEALIAALASLRPSCSSSGAR